jgi:hypothetical protein
LVNSSEIFSQSPNNEIHFTPEGIFDNVFDKDGTIYKLSDIIAGNEYVSKNGTTTSNTFLCTSGIFELYFETGCGMENTTNYLHNQRRAILCQAFQDISDFINTPLKNVGNTNKVKIWIRNPSNLTPTLPAAAGAASHSIFPDLNSVRSLKIQSDGKLIIGGYFDTYNQITATNITRIYPFIAGSQLKSNIVIYQSEPEIDIMKENQITIYPNPSDGIYYFNLTEEDSDTQLIIFNLLGEQVFSSLLLGKQENKIDLPNLAKGCYLVKLSNSGNISTQKLIKN